MKKNILYGILLLITLHCADPKTKRVGVDSFVNQRIAKTNKLDSILIEGVLSLVQNKEYLKYPDIPLHKSFITITFVLYPESKQIYFSDSTVNIRYNVFPRNDSLNYKGILEIDGINVAIFDKGNFGNKYYNADSLKHIPLDRFNHYPMTTISTRKYYVNNGVLNYWNP
jgi:hypothetical protein